MSIEQYSDHNEDHNVTTTPDGDIIPIPDKPDEEGFTYYEDSRKAKKPSVRIETVDAAKTSINNKLVEIASRFYAETAGQLRDAEAQQPRDVHKVARLQRELERHATSLAVRGALPLEIDKQQ